MDEKLDVGADLVARLRETVDDQVHNAIALRIRTKVRDARSDPDAASLRWPFELIQNAHDAGPRPDRDGISLSFSFIDGVLRFEHDAAPFEMDEFAALLTGGSSKDFLSTDTTGRFGTGFLVTHVLSERVKVSGILEVDGTYRAFQVELDRPNDEERLLQNVRDSQSSLLHTRLIDKLSHEPTASFEYVVDDGRIATAGLDAVEQSLPHLFATCQRLKEIRIQREGRHTTWKSVNQPKEDYVDGIQLKQFSVSRHERNGDLVEWRLVRAANSINARGRLIVGLREIDGVWTVCKPGQLSSVFRQLPLLGGPSLPGWAIIDGEFEVEQERRSIHVTGEAQQPLREAFAALGGLMLVANREGWSNGFRIAQLSLPPEVTGETATTVWRDILSSSAQSLSHVPLVQSIRGDKLPCVAGDGNARYADFIQRGELGATHEEIWELAAACTEIDLPDNQVSEGWSEVAEGWEKLGVEISWIDLETVGQRASNGASGISELRVDGDKYRWLCHYINAVGKSWDSNGIVKSYLDNLLPNQHGKLRSADQLSRDAGIHEGIKRISTDIGLDIQSQLLDQEIIAHLTSNNLDSGLSAINEATNGDVTEDDAIDEIVQTISSALPDEEDLNEENEKEAAASITLLSHLWITRGKEAESIAWKIPLLTSDNAAHLPGRRRRMIPPLSTWPETARPFSVAYPTTRILTDRYSTEDRSLLEALSYWGIAYSGLLEANTREEISERGLKAIADDPEQVTDATLRKAQLMQISLLEPELINYCKQSRERAAALLGLVVCYVAPEDTSWRTSVEVSVEVADIEKSVRLTPSMWLSDLRSKPWIPVEVDGEIVHYTPTPELIRDILDPTWLEENPDGANLLVRHFGIDELDVRLLAAAKDDEARQRLRNSLAKIIEIVGNDSEVIEALVINAQQRKRDVERMRKLGLAVQECIKVAMEKRGLKVRDVDHGYDYLVSSVNVREDDSEELTSYFEVGEYKVEVKTTTTGEARLTPLQASTSAENPDLFVLCVVDLRNFDGDVHEIDWADVDVTALTKLLSGRKLPTAQTLSFVHHAEGSEVPIRNTTALRYAVKPNLWETGFDFDQWVQDSFTKVRATRS